MGEASAATTHTADGPAPDGGRPAPTPAAERVRRLELVMAASGFGDWSWDGRTNQVSLSPRAARILGYSGKAELAWSDLAPRLHPEDLMQGRLAVRDAGRGEAFEFECRLRQDDGGETWVQVRGETFYEEDGQRALFGVVSDISRAKAAEAKLRESEARFRAMAEAAPAPVWATSPGGPIEFVNEAFAEFAGHASEELLGDFWMTMIHPDDLPVVGAIRAEARKTLAAYTFEARFRRADGEWRLMRASSKPRFDEIGTFLGYVGLSVDVTEMREAVARQQLLINELNHRVKNTLATVQSVIRQTLRRERPAGEARETLTARLVALAAAHDVLTRENWESAAMGDIVAQATAHLGGARRFDIAGPLVRLPPKTALAMSMALHELATNAAKYGSLSNESGRVRIGWTLDGAALTLTWREEGGPPVAKPAAAGFGTRLLRKGLVTDLGAPAELTYAPDGLVSVIRARNVG
jgi:PAS domain S-box-containing protein